MTLAPVQMTDPNFYCIRNSLQKNMMHNVDYAFSVHFSFLVSVVSTNTDNRNNWKMSPLFRQIHCNIDIVFFENARLQTLDANITPKNIRTPY